ncbi:MAG TPA: hypothetical protein VJ654_11210 [Noviherbaspirillum sp.]|nr:hypothetical protein [Noviherbaspirillum sp.]
MNGGKSEWNIRDIIAQMGATGSLPSERRFGCLHPESSHGKLALQKTINFKEETC